MFIKRNKSHRGDSIYTSVLLVQGERVPAPRDPGRPRKGEAPTTKVVHHTLANLSKLPEVLVALIERFCKAERTGQPLDQFVPATEPVVGPAFGPLAALFMLARQLGIDQAMGPGRKASLALFLVLARVAHQGSRLSAVRWAKDHAVHEVLGLEPFDEDDLYEALDWLAANQERIEQELAPHPEPGAVFLYDVTSSYLEGQKNELAAPGYNRDGKRYKKQIVAGLLTDVHGEPVAIRVYEGNTSDPDTVEDQVRKLADQLGAREVVLVGDRGMIKAKGRELLAKEGFRYITSLTDPEIRKALATGTLQLGLFDERVTEVSDTDRRYILRRNPAMTKRTRSRRADQLARVQAKVDARNAKVAASTRADPQVSLRDADKWLATYKLNVYVTAELHHRAVRLVVDEDARTQRECLDGCYVVVTDLPASAADAQTVWDRYGDLQRVERDFRTMKTTLLELRPIFLRKANRTRAHAFVTMLALKLSRELERRVAPLGLTCEDALDRLTGVRLVTLADPALGLWRLPTRWSATQQEVLEVLPRLPPPRLSLRPAGGTRQN
ncbi:MAG: IS1634 family transposase [Pseudomonadota bacterium]